MTTFYLLRHGETDWNAEGRLQGHSPSNLSAKGKQEALDARSQLPADYASWPCYCSDLKRTRDTATILLNGETGQVQYRPDLREISLGHWEGQLRSEAQPNNPELFHTFKQNASAFSIEGGESFHDVQSRAITFLHEAAARHPDDNVLVVSHRGWIKSALCHLENRSLDEQWLPPLIGNCSVSIVRFEPTGSGQILRYGDADTWSPPHAA